MENNLNNDSYNHNKKYDEKYLNIYCNQSLKVSKFTAILITIIVFFILNFFLLYNAKGISKISSWIVLFYLTFGFYKLISTGKISFYRKFLFIFGALTFFPSFIGLLIESRGEMALTYRQILLNETPFCHIVFPMVIFPYILEKVLIFPARLTGDFASFYSMLVIITISILTVGRGWCSWVCFYGGWDECLSTIPKKAIIKIEDKNKRLRYFNFVMLTVIILGSLATFSVIFCQWFCPWKLITEYEKIVDLRTFLAFILMILLFFILVIVFPYLTKKRIQCMSYCPFGALQSLTDRISFFRIKIDSNLCKGCLICAKNCPTMSIDENSILEKKPKVLITCTKCGECIQICPQKAIRYDYFFKPSNLILNQVETNDQLKNKKLEYGRKKILKNIFKTFLFTLNEIKEVKVLFPFSGWILGSIVMGGFMVDTITRILNIFINGSFLLK